MPGPAPKPNAHRSTNHPPRFDWIHLPAEGRQGPPPPLPDWHAFTDDARTEWTAWWSTPWATQWRDHEPALHRLLYIFDQVITGDGNAALMSEARQIEDRFGFSPKSRLQLRWLLTDEEAANPKPSSPTAKARRRTLKVV